jgi:predicted glutamine amidotransferase
MARGENALNEKNTSIGLVKHGDAWGAVLEAGGRTTCVRSGRACWDDPAFAQVGRARVKLLHARLASSAGCDEAHAHPFSAEIRGEAWRFCHNGTLHDEPHDGTDATDSERFFRRMARRLESADPVSAFEAATSSLQKVTALDSLLLGPDGLWAFCVWTDLHYPTYYTLVWADTPHGILVASEPIEDVATRWVPIDNGWALWIPTRRDAATSGPRLVRLRLPAALTPAAE